MRSAKSHIASALAVAFAVLTAFGSAACGKKSTPGILEINFTIAGYGDAYVSELIDAFREETGIEVAEPTFDDNQTNSSIARVTSYKNCTTDLFFTMVPMFNIVDSSKNKGGYDNLILELSDLYDRQVPGKNKTLREIVDPQLYDANKQFDPTKGDAGIYTVPWTTSVEGLIANRKVLAKYGIEKLPRTTDEFLEVLDVIKSGRTLTGGIVSPADRVRGAITCANNSAYWHFVWPTWWAQYDGLEAIDHYFSAKPDSATSDVYVPDWQALESDGKLVAIEEMYRFLNKDQGYMDPNSVNRNHIESQVDFLDGKAAFIPSGAWIETETAQDYYDRNEDVSFVMMRTPVTSRLGEKLGITEEELRAAIDWADGVSAEKPTFSGKDAQKTDEILAAVSDARGLVCSGLTGQNKIVIPAYSDSIEEAYRFVLFYASDRAQEILLKYGILSAFGYQSSAIEQTSEFVQSMAEIVSADNTRLVISGQRYPMAYKAGLDYTAHSVITSATKGFENLIYEGSKTAKNIYNEDIGYYRNQWERMLVNAGYGKK